MGNENAPAGRSPPGKKRYYDSDHECNDNRRHDMTTGLHHFQVALIDFITKFLYAHSAMFPMAPLR